MDDINNQIQKKQEEIKALQKESNRIQKELNKLQKDEGLMMRRQFAHELMSLLEKYDYQIATDGVRYRILQDFNKNDPDFQYFMEELTGLKWKYIK